jgi:hypothetical protein
MPGSLWAPFREGNRSEYLAQYFLSALGVSVSVPRPEDIGIDFYCALAKQAGERLTFHSPFAVQVGSYGTKDFSYGGFTKKGVWQKEQLDWLFSQELPLFIATVDKDSLSFRLYSTSPIWVIKYKFGEVLEVRLIPDAVHDPLTDSCENMADYAGKGGDGCRYNVPLGPPVVALSIAELKTDIVDSARVALARASFTEMRNLTYRRLGVHFSQWMLDVPPNDDSSTWNVRQFYAWNSEPGRNTPEQLEALLPIIVALAHNLKSQNRMDELAQLKGVFGLIPKDKIPPFVQTNLPELL